MSVTLDVSQLSGWLNAVAYCRIEKEATCDAGHPGGGGGLWGSVAAQAACTAPG